MPLHTQLLITLIAGCTTFCLTLGVAGAILRKCTAALPPVPIFPGSRFPGIFTQVYTTFLLITFAGSTIAECCLPEPPPPAELNWMSLLESSLIQIMLYVPLLVVYFMQPAPIRPRWSLPATLTWLFLGLLVLTLPAILLQVAGFHDWLVEATGCPAQQDVVELLISGPMEVKIIVAIMAVVVAPITEECCFRGCLYNILKQYSPPLLSAVASGLLFAAVHNSLAQFLPLAFFGIFQCFAYEKARSLWLPIMLHIFFNATSIIFLFLWPHP